MGRHLEGKTLTNKKPMSRWKVQFIVRYTLDRIPILELLFGIKSHRFIKICC